MFPALLMAGVGLKAYSIFRAGKEDAKQARRNAARARMLAAQALQRGEQKAGLIELASSRRQGAQLAAYGHAGVDPTSGSAAKVISTTAMVGALDAEIARQNAFRESFGYSLQATSFEREASQAEDRWKFDMFGAVFGGMGSLAASSGSGE